MDIKETEYSFIVINCFPAKKTINKVKKRSNKGIKSEMEKMQKYIK